MRRPDDEPDVEEYAHGGSPREASDPSHHAMVCYARCWECINGHHFDPPHWHTWADEEDELHAAATGQPDPTESKCGCYCADEPVRS